MTILRKFPQKSDAGGIFPLSSAALAENACNWSVFLKSLMLAAREFEANNFEKNPEKGFWHAQQNAGVRMVKNEIRGTL